MTWSVFKTPLLCMDGTSWVIWALSLPSAAAFTYFLPSTQGIRVSLVASDELPYHLFLTMAQQHDQHVECVASLGSREAFLACRSY